jgi:hypothetical protein
MDWLLENLGELITGVDHESKCTPQFRIPPAFRMYGFSLPVD